MNRTEQTLLVIDRSSWQKINKDVIDLNKTINQLDQIDVHRKLPPISEKHTFFSFIKYSPKSSTFWS